MFTVLLVAEKGREVLRSSLEERNGLKILEATSESGALKWMEERPADVVFLDEEILHEQEGKRLFRLLREKNRRVKISVTTMNPSFERAVQFVKCGALDYFVLPKDIERMRGFLEESLREWMRRGQGESRKRWTFDSIVGESDGMRQVVELSRRVAESDVSPVLIRGETGSGKELIARAIHYASLRSNMSFVEINMTAIPETLLEAELFGYEKGAFTDAKQQKKGMFEMADGGTLFLDEIGHMSLGLQMKLLKVVEDKIFRRLGGTKDLEVNIRIIAATNANLEEAIQKETFRKDLYFRLNAVSIYLPPLRDRGEDILLLARHFLENYKQGGGSQIDRLSPDVEESLLQYSWPGNVRELKNGVERAALLGNENLVLPQDAFLQDLHSTREKEEGRRKEVDLYSYKEGIHSLLIPREGITFEEMERKLIEEILAITHWNKSEASRLLKISRPRLLRKIEKYQISRSLPQA